MKNLDIETVGKRHLIGKPDKDLPEQGGGLLGVRIGPQFAVLDASTYDVTPEQILLFHACIKFALAVRIIEEHLLVEVEITGVG